MIESTPRPRCTEPHRHVLSARDTCPRPLEELDDVALVERVRAGDDDASLVLWRRHHERERTVITALLMSRGAADDLLRRGFAEVLAEIRAGTDPLASFEIYLRTSLLFKARFDGVDPGTRAPVVRAFLRLSRLDQTSLWESALDLVGFFDLPGMGAASHRVLVLPVVRSIERLRWAWMAEILDVPGLSGTCAWFIERIDVLRDDSISPAYFNRFQRHAAACAHCARFVEDYDSFPRNLFDALAPVLARAQRPPSSLGGDEDPS